MFAMSILAVGIVLLAVTLSIRWVSGVPSVGGWSCARQATGVAGQRQGGGLPASERGFTLQTLIVTAVLVLMAVAAGVIIVAITNSSSDDLEEQSQDLEGRCTGTEIYDIELAVAGVKAQQGRYTANFPATAVEGSAPGCIPVCFWNEGDIHADDPRDPDGFIEAHEIEFWRELKEHQLIVDDPNRQNFDTDPQISITIFKDPTTIAGALASGHGIPGLATGSYQEFTIPPSVFHSSLVDAVEVRVAPDGENCYIYNSSGQIAEVR